MSADPLEPENLGLDACACCADTLRRDEPAAFRFSELLRERLVEATLAAIRVGGHA